MVAGRKIEGIDFQMDLIGEKAKSFFQIGVSLLILMGFEKMFAVSHELFRDCRRPFLKDRRVKKF